MTDQEREVVIRLIRAAQPFTLGTTVEETSGTIPLMEELERALEAACPLVAMRVLSAEEIRAEYESSRPALIRPPDSRAGTW